MAEKDKQTESEPPSPSGYVEPREKADPEHKDEGQRQAERLNEEQAERQRQLEEKA